MVATGRRTPTVLFVDRSNGSQFRSGKKHRADHSVLPDSPTVWARLTAAAAEASCNDAGELLPQRCLWRHVDRQIETKSVAVKATVQALCLHTLAFPDPTLARWMALARVVAEGAHALLCVALACVMSARTFRDALARDARDSVCSTRSARCVFASTHRESRSFPCPRAGTCSTARASSGG